MLPRIAYGLVEAVDVQAATARADAPATHITDLRRWMVPWRPSAGTSSWIQLDYGAQLALGLLWVHAIVADSIRIDTATDFYGPYTPRTALITPVPSDLRVGGRAKIVADLRGITARYVRATITGSSATMAIGAMGMFSTVVDLPAGIAAPYRWTVRQAVQSVEYAHGGLAQAALGPAYLELEWAAPPWTRASGMLEAVLGAVASERHRWLVYDERRGNAAHVYLLERLDDITIAEHRAHYEATLRFREVM